MTKQFHITDILTITTGFLVSNRHMEGVYEILNFLTNDNLYTHQLPRAGRTCEPVLLQQFPQLAKYTAELTETSTEQRSVRAEAIAELEGGTLCVTDLESWTMNAQSWQERDPIEELVDMVGKDKVIVTGASR